jgi:hypothetical protein
MHLQAAQMEQSLLQVIIITATSTRAQILASPGHNALDQAQDTGKDLQAAQMEQSLLQAILEVVMEVAATSTPAQILA